MRSYADGAHSRYLTSPLFSTCNPKFLYDSATLCRPPSPSKFRSHLRKVIINELESEIWNRSKNEIDQREHCSDDLLIELVLPELEVIGKLAQVRIVLEHLQPVVVALIYSLHLLLPLRLGRHCLSGLDLFWGAKGLIQDIILQSDVICSLGHR